MLSLYPPHRPLSVCVYPLLHLFINLSSCSRIFLRRSMLLKIHRSAWLSVFARVYVPSHICTHKYTRSRSLILTSTLSLKPSHTHIHSRMHTHKTQTSHINTHAHVLSFLRVHYHSNPRTLTFARAHSHTHTHLTHKYTRAHSLSY